jgi:DnaJ-class molecular chaperone
MEGFLCNVWFDKDDKYWAFDNKAPDDIFDMTLSPNSKFYGRKIVKFRIRPYKTCSKCGGLGLPYGCSDCGITRIR